MIPSPRSAGPAFAPLFAHSPQGYATTRDVSSKDIEMHVRRHLGRLGPRGRVRAGGV